MSVSYLRVGYLAKNAGTIPFSARSSGTYLMANSGENTGNLAFWHATRQMFDDPITLVEWGSDGARYADTVDRLVIPAANHLNPQWDLGALADLIESLGKEVLVFGLGAQSQEENRPCELQPGTIRYVRALGAHAKTVFVRGNYSADVCASYGVRNVEAIGCPSITMNADPRLGELIVSRQPANPRKLYFAGAALKQENIPIERKMFEYVNKLTGSTFVIQAPAELADLAMGRTNLDRPSPLLERAHQALDPTATAAEFADKFSRVVRCYGSVRAWLEDAATHDFAFATRIHGGIMAMMAGVPTLVVGHDTRIRELCDILLIPWIRPGQALTMAGSLGGLAACKPLDGAAFDLNRRQIARRYREYLGEAGLTVSAPLLELAGAVEPAAQGIAPI